MGTNMAIETQLKATPLSLGPVEAHELVHILCHVPVLICTFDHAVMTSMPVATKRHTAGALIDLPFPTGLTVFANLFKETLTSTEAEVFSSEKITCTVFVGFPASGARGRLLAFIESLP